MGLRNDIAARVRAAQRDTHRADDLVRDYLPFIKAETAKFMGRSPVEGSDDELGIAMFAFHEAIMAYDARRGAFLPLVARFIKNRLIDYRRREARHLTVVSLDAATEDADGDERRPLAEQLAGEHPDMDEGMVREATRKEIAELAALLETFGVSFGDVADNCPKQDRTLEVCRQAIRYAREHVELIEQLEKTGRLPLAALAKGAGVERKTLERHRRYLVAMLLIYTNGFDIIRGHLYKVVGVPRKLAGGDAA